MIVLTFNRALDLSNYYLLLFILVLLIYYIINSTNFIIDQIDLWLVNLSSFYVPYKLVLWVYTEYVSVKYLHHIWHDYSLYQSIKCIDWLILGH